MSEDDFVAAVSEGQAAAPPYFAFAAGRNKAARELLVEGSPPPPLDLDAVLGHQAGGAVVLDTRSPADFALGHLSRSVNVGLEGRFAEYAGDVITPDQDIVLVSEPGTELEARTRLGRIGFDRVVGALEEPQAAFLSRPDLVAPSSRLTVAGLAERMGAREDLQVVDVRAPGEARLGAVPGAVNIPLPQLLARRAELDPARPTVVHCAGGYRSSIAASLLRAQGFADVSDLLGGYDAWAKQHDGLSRPVG
jgi:hydroxyacylglutathione hydrolase